MNASANPVSRRSFLGKAACACLGTHGIVNALGTLRLFNATLAAQTVPDDGAKALVCLFLFGGNDANNVLIPYDQAGYDAYSIARGGLALPREAVVPVSLSNGSDGREFALHPSLGLLQGLFDEGRMAFINNLGTLVAPITQAEFRGNSASVPPYLFSHDDQQVQWQTSVPDSTAKIGWGGRIADLLRELNDANSISMNISIAGNNFFQVGNETLQYPMTTEGSVGLTDYLSQSAPRNQQYLGLNKALRLSYSNLFESEYAAITNRAISKDLLVKDTLSSAPRFDRAATEDAPNDRNCFPNARSATSGKLTNIGSQLHMVLRLIASQGVFGMRRQVFFCALGGWDTHEDQLDDHAALLRALGDAVHDFYRATVTLGIADRVTLFTASDFNRTYISNGKGSDHAWGGAQFVVGGSVAGGRLYGRLPILRAGGPDDTGGRGSWIPTTSTDEYAATLAKWFGVSPGNMPLVLPNISRFATPDIGFMR